MPAGLLKRCQGFRVASSGAAVPLLLLSSVCLLVALLLSAGTVLYFESLVLYCETVLSGGRLFNIFSPSSQPRSGTGKVPGPQTLAGCAATGQALAVPRHLLLRAPPPPPQPPWDYFISDIFILSFSDTEDFPSCVRIYFFELFCPQRAYN